jgi:hypothetical protein
MAAVNYDMKSKSNNLMFILHKIHVGVTGSKILREPQNEPLSLLNNNV